MANKIKIKANRGGIRYLGTWSKIPREVREKLASCEPITIDASYLSFMDSTSYELLEERVEDNKVEETILNDVQTDDTVEKMEEIVKPKPKSKKKKLTKSTLDPSTEEEKNEFLKEN